MSGNKLHTAVNLDMNIMDEPYEIAEKIMQGFLIPILNRKAQVGGVDESVQLYIDLSYVMLAERVRVIGREGISEMRDLVDELEAELDDMDKAKQTIFVQRPQDFMELSKQVS